MKTALQLKKTYTLYRKLWLFEILLFMVIIIAQYLSSRYIIIFNFMNHTGTCFLPEMLCGNPANTLLDYNWTAHNAVSWELFAQNSAQAEIIDIYRALAYNIKYLPVISFIFFALITTALVFVFSGIKYTIAKTEGKESGFPDILKSSALSIFLYFIFLIILMVVSFLVLSVIYMVIIESIHILKRIYLLAFIPFYILYIRFSLCLPSLLCGETRILSAVKESWKLSGKFYMLRLLLVSFTVHIFVYILSVFASSFFNVNLYIYIKAAIRIAGNLFLLNYYIVFYLERKQESI